MISASSDEEGPEGASERCGSPLWLQTRLNPPRFRGFYSKEIRTQRLLRCKTALGSLSEHALAFHLHRNITSSFRTPPYGKRLGNVVRSASISIGGAGCPRGGGSPAPPCWEFCASLRNSSQKPEGKKRVTPENNIHSKIILLKRRTVCYYGVIL